MKPNKKQQQRIDALRKEIEATYQQILQAPRRKITVDDLFQYAVEGDFDWEGEPEDVGNAYDCEDDDCSEHWHISVQTISMGRENGKRWYVVCEDSISGSGDYQPVAGFDEREGDEVSEDVLADLWFHHEGRLHQHFYRWAKYNLYCAETGRDPLNNCRRDSTVDDNIKAAEDNLRYLLMGLDKA